MHLLAPSVWLSNPKEQLAVGSIKYVNNMQIICTLILVSFFAPPFFFISLIEEIFNVLILLLRPSGFMSMVKTSSQEFFLLTFVNEFIRISALTVVYLLLKGMFSI